MAEFYDHPETGHMHFKAIAGGHGGGSTSVYDAPATAADVAAFPSDHSRYLAAKKRAAHAAQIESEKVAELARIAAHANQVAEEATALQTSE